MLAICIYMNTTIYLVEPQKKYSACIKKLYVVCCKFSGKNITALFLVAYRNDEKVRIPDAGIFIARIPGG